MNTINRRRTDLERDRGFRATELQHLETEGKVWHDEVYIQKRCRELRAEIKEIDEGIAHLNLLETLKYVSYFVVPLLWLGLSILAGVLIGGAVFAVMFFAGVAAGAVFAIVSAIRNGIEDRAARRSRR